MSRFEKKKGEGKEKKKIFSSQTLTKQKKKTGMKCSCLGQNKH